jgi:hypothetical protein
MQRPAVVLTSVGVPIFHFSFQPAHSFIKRLKGFFLNRDSVGAILLSPCAVVHTFGCSKPLQLVYLDASGRVLGVTQRTRRNRIYGRWGASQVLEVKGMLLPLEPGDKIASDLGLVKSDRMNANSPSGFAFVESLIVLPLLLLSVMGAIQVALLWHAKFAVNHAVNVAARHASLNHGSHDAIRDGLVQGLMPLFGRSASLPELPKALFRSGAEVTQGLAMGYLQWEVLSPTRQSFADWGEPGDPFLSPGVRANDTEIPSSPLPALATRRKPRSGVSGFVDGIPIGKASSQTLLDANTLKLHLQVGVPINMPVAGKLLANALSYWQGCGVFSESRDRVGLVDFGAGAEAMMLSSRIECRALAARDLSGRWAPRWPVEASAVVRMHSNARQSVMKLRDRQQSVD